MLKTINLQNLSRITHSEIILINLPKTVHELQNVLRDPQNTRFCNYDSLDNVRLDLKRFKSYHVSVAAAIRLHGNYYLVPLDSTRSNTELMTDVLKALKNSKNYQIHFAIIDTKRVAV